MLELIEFFGSWNKKAHRIKRPHIVQHINFTTEIFQRFSIRWNDVIFCCFLPNATEIDVIQIAWRKHIATTSTAAARHEYYFGAKRIAKIDNRIAPTRVQNSFAIHDKPTAIQNPKAEKREESPCTKWTQRCRRRRRTVMCCSLTLVRAMQLQLYHRVKTLSILLLSAACLQMSICDSQKRKHAK